MLRAPQPEYTAYIALQDAIAVLSQAKPLVLEALSRSLGHGEPHPLIRDYPASARRNGESAKAHLARRHSERLQHYSLHKAAFQAKESWATGVLPKYLEAINSPNTVPLFPSSLSHNPSFSSPYRVRIPLEDEEFIHTVLPPQSPAPVACADDTAGIAGDISAPLQIEPDLEEEFRRHGITSLFSNCPSNGSQLSLEDLLASTQLVNNVLASYLQRLSRTGGLVFDLEEGRLNERLIQRQENGNTGVSSHDCSLYHSYLLFSAGSGHSE